MARGFVESIPVPHPRVHRQGSSNGGTSFGTKDHRSAYRLADAKSLRDSSGRATRTVARRIALNAPSLPQRPGIRGVETDSSGRFATAALASPSPRAITSARQSFDPAYQGRTNLYVVVNS